MTWFGWLTKSHYEVTALDKLTFFCELSFAFGVIILLWVSYLSIANFFNKLFNKKKIVKGRF